MSNLYKVGDKVRILKPFLEDQINMHPGWIHGKMDQYHRKITHISYVGHTTYKLDGCSTRHFCNEWLEPVGRYKIGDKVTMRKPLEDYDSQGVRYGLSWSSPAMDKYDGASVEIWESVSNYRHRIQGDWLITPAWIVHGNIEEKAAVAAPKNNDGRANCFWCGGVTKKSLGFNSHYDICTGCGK